MNDYGNNILLASQDDSDLVLITEEGGDYPVGSKVFYYHFGPELSAVDITNLTDGSALFAIANLRVDWDADLPNIKTASGMFQSCGVKSFTGKLPNLEIGDSMFSWCSELKSFAGELPKLVDGTNMFNTCRGLTSWTVALPNLADGSYMFFECRSLTSLTADLSSLTTGDSMFSGCTGLTSFNAGTEGLKSLSDGTNMFDYCILDETSVLHILNTIPTHTSGTHKLKLGNRINYKTSEKVAAKLRTSTGETVSIPIPLAADYRCVDNDGNDKGWTIST